MLGFLILAGSNEMPVWHCEQSPLEGWLRSATLNWPAAPCGRLWKPPYPAMGYSVMPTHCALVSWQEAQLDVTPACTISLLGLGFWKPVPGTVLVATGVIWPEGMLPAWQVSQLVELGMCALGPGLLESGMTTMLLMPAKLLPVMPGPWQLAQPLLMPAWLNLELLNLAPSTTGSCRLLPAPTWQASQL